MFVLLLSCVVSALLLTVSAQGTCTEAGVQECYDLFTEYETNIVNTSIMSVLDDENLDQHCGDYENVKSCLDDFERHCHPLDQLTFLGQDLAYEWLCEKAKQEYRAIRQCFASVELHAEGDRCHATLSESLDDIDHTRETSPQKICLYANTYLDCVENAVKSECNERAADWQREFDRRTLQPILLVVECQLDSDGYYYLPNASEKDDDVSTHTWVIIGCIIAISLIMVVVLVLLLFRIRQKRKQRSVARENRSVAYINNGMDPSAAVVYPGGAMAGPLPTKGPIPPPEYDNQPPPSYASDTGALPYKTVPPSSYAPSVAGSSRSHPPEYRSTAGSVRAPPSESRYVAESTRGAPSVCSGAGSHRGEAYDSYDYVLPQ